ncbi:hypothetical protein GYMLUDRAFT_246195 [Collybiopsis luxurians FD-317 M1]|uniref:MFS general substrate transporter n=1 Tax=Collybiopsis luxurians FD-317 M1 TaxID=944289 RepID=A0A0D0C6L2_9AGAR|nr:hypothetical protein GYMLUDRAFT_246195 [Collybiopsis luxurians FD-317 M1]
MSTMDLQEESLAANHSVSESTPLLQISSPVEDSTYPWYSPKRYHSPAICLIPVVLIARLAASIPASTTVYVVQQNVCRLYYTLHDPDRIPPEGPMPDELCDAPGVQQQFSAFIASIGALNGFACVIGYSALSHFSSRYGRKPAIILILALGLFSNLCLLLSTWHRVNEIWEIVLLVLWILCDAFASIHMMGFLSTTYVVDIVDPDNRSSLLSTVYGWGLLGGAIAFGLGGVITTKTHNVLPVFRSAAILNALNLLFTCFFLPESFPKEKRDELRRRASEETQYHRKGSIRQLVSKLGAAFAPMKMLKPVYNEQTGRRNWRLVWCALYILLVEIGGNYTPTAAVIYLTARFNYKADDIGFLLGFLCITYTLTSTILVPAIIRALRPLYRRKAPGNNDAEGHDMGTDQLEIHISVISWIAEIVGFLLLSYMTTKTGHYAGMNSISFPTLPRITVYAAALITALGAGRAPLFRSIVAASVEPLKQGETIAAVEMVASVGVLISPMYMGAVLSASISTMPSLVFYLNGLIVLMGTSVLFLIKDSDRYQAPNAGR